MKFIKRNWKKFTRIEYFVIFAISTSRAKLLRNMKNQKDNSCNELNTKKITKK